MKHESDGNSNCNWCTQNSYQIIDKGTGGLGNKGTSGDHPEYSIINTSQNTKSPGHLQRLTVTQTPVENHWLALVWKTCKRLR